jgi:hypothetical protein
MKELRLKFLNIVLAKLEQDRQQGDYHMGICINIDRLQFEYERKDVSTFKIWFRSQKPHFRFHSKFTKHTHWLGGDFWWVRTQEGCEQRILFLKHLIEKQS